MPFVSGQFFPFRPIAATPLRITYEDIRDVMQEMSKAGKSAATGKTYAVMDPRTGNTYPPKEVLTHVVARLKPGRSYAFFGGKGWDGANRIFQAFGFPVGKRKTLVKKWESLKRRNTRISNVDQLLRTLFSQRWRILRTGDELANIVSHCPGVYILAYSRQNLHGKVVQEKHVFYVGMTCEGGMNTRLGMFRDGIARSKRLTLRRGVAAGIFHSAAARFRRIWLRGKAYDPKAPVRLYFAYLSLDSETAKPWRTPNDLRNLGTVVELEYAAIARVKSVIGHEPLLNSK
jgi:hypothetical protein